MTSSDSIGPAGLPVLSKAEFQDTIWSNYDDQGRSFPWRQTRDPYAIMVSEIMLQQTQTERVIPKYTSWMERFPTARDVALAPLSEVLSYWSGLGYNRRARFLQEACRSITDSWFGIVPRNPSDLEKLPGIGPYTARAISCFSYGTAEPFIETNIRSVYIFFFFPEVLEPGYEGPAVTDRQLLEKIAETQPEAGDAHHPQDTLRHWYYALMDYGAVLKKKIRNPNRKSAHYTRQSKFEGSLRQARGAILRQLVKESDPKNRKTITLCDIVNTEYIELERLKKAADVLCAEGFIQPVAGTEDTFCLREL